jgi:hypothetical protein
MLRPRIILRLFIRYLRGMLVPLGFALIAIFLVATAAGFDIVEASMNYARLKQYEKELTTMTPDPRIPQVVAPVPKTPQTTLPFRMPIPYDPNDPRLRLRNI